VHEEFTHSMKLSHITSLICSTKRRDPVGRTYASYSKSPGFKNHPENPVFQTDIIRDFQHLLQANSGTLPTLSKDSLHSRFPQFVSH
jgi:hypothetical protein